MPLDFDAAKSVVKGATSAADFSMKCWDSNVRWWEATAKQRDDLMKETDKPDVKEIVDVYCRPVGVSLAKQFLANNVIPTDKRGRIYWLQTFLLECSRGSTMSTQETRSMQDAYQLLLRKTSPVGPDVMLKTPIEQIPPLKFRAILETFLSAGFVRFPTTDAAKGAEQFAAQILDATKSYTGPRQYKARWRSDSRSYGDIDASGGFLAKARSADSFASRFGMRELWHPFNDPKHRNYMWFRKGQLDNCLNTVVSVGIAKDWKAYLPFPLMKDYPEMLKKRRILVNSGGRQVPVDVGVSYTWLYLFVMKDLLALQTGKFGETLGGAGAFPEIGVGQIPIGNIYGAVRFARIYHMAFPSALNATTGEQLDSVGFTAYPVEVIAPPKTKFIFSNVQPVPPGVIEVKKAFNSARLTEPVHVCWTSTGFKTVTANFDVGGVNVQLSPASFGMI